jgi:tRNA-specific adenosine deaminase 1
MLHTAAYQPPSMAQLKASSTGYIPPFTPGEAVRGRNGYDNYGAVRTKPGRADSTPTISMSCSDKLASWSALGMQGALLAEVFEPVYLDHVVIGGVEEAPPEGVSLPHGTNWHERIRGEAERALWGRVEFVAGKSSYTLSVALTSR